MARPIERIYIHCSASPFGDVASIRKFHTDPPPLGRGWKDIGYHYVVCNGFPNQLSFKEQKPVPKFVGLVQPGRPEERMGSHCGRHFYTKTGIWLPGDNAKTLAVCLIGGHPEDFVPEQIEAAAKLTASLCVKYHLNSPMVVGHAEYWTAQNLEPLKRCPVVNMKAFRLEVNKHLIT